MYSVIADRIGGEWRQEVKGLFARGKTPNIGQGVSDGVFPGAGVAWDPPEKRCSLEQAEVVGADAHEKPHGEGEGFKLAAFGDRVVAVFRVRNNKDSVIWG